MEMKVWALSHPIFPRSREQLAGLVGSMLTIEPWLKTHGKASIVINGYDVIDNDEVRSDYKITSTSLLSKDRCYCYAGRVYKDSERTVFLNMTEGSTTGYIYVLDVNRNLTFTGFEMLDKDTDERYNMLVDAGSTLYLPHEI